MRYSLDKGKNMIKSELIAHIAAEMTNLSEKQVNDAVNHILTVMSEAITHNQRIEIRGFGSFSLHFRPPRSAHNPKTGEKVLTKAKYSAHFKPGKEMRERVAASYHQYPINEERTDEDH